MDPFHITGVLKSGSHHSWANFYSGEWETPENISFIFAFALTATKKKQYDTLKEGGNK